MKLKKSTYILGLLFILLMTTPIYAATSQITFPDDVDDQGPQAPIDGFVVVGIAAGAILGLRKNKKA